MLCGDTRHCPVGSGGLNRVWESNPSLLDWQTGDRSLGDLGCATLKEVGEERVLQRFLYGMEHHPYVWSDALHKNPLLLEGLLQYCIGGLRVLTRHPGRMSTKYFHPSTFLANH